MSPIGRLQTKREVKQLFLKFIQSIPKPMVIIVCIYFKFSQLRGHVSRIQILLNQRFDVFEVL